MKRLDIDPNLIALQTQIIESTLRGEYFSSGYGEEGRNKVADVLIYRDDKFYLIRITEVEPLEPVKPIVS